MVTTRISLLGIAASLVCAAVSPATIHRVPSEYATINGALDVSAFGDTVLVAPGTYTDWENHPGPANGESSAAFLVDGVVLKSEGGSSVTFIDMQGGGIGFTNAISARFLPSDRYELKWSGVDASGNRTAPGTYFVRFRVGDHVQTAKVTVLR